MQIQTSTDSKMYLFVLLPALPSFLGGLILLQQLPAHFSTVSMLLLMVVCSLIAGHYLWQLHARALLQRQHAPPPSHEDLDQLMSYTMRLEKLLLTAEPKILEQVVAARTLTEKEIAILLRSFSNIREELTLISDFDSKTLDNSEHVIVDSFRNSLQKIRSEIDVILTSLQFQDRVSQILVIVQDNLATLRAALEFIQQQGSERDQNMLQVEELLTKIEVQYETVKHYALPVAAENSADELILF